MAGLTMWLRGKELPLALLAACCLATATILLTVDHDSAPVALKSKWVYSDEPVHGTPEWDWGDKANVKVFYGRCLEGDEAACEELVQHKAALATLTRMGNDESQELEPVHDWFWAKQPNRDWMEKEEEAKEEEEDDGWPKAFSTWGDEFHAFNEPLEEEEGEVPIGETSSEAAQEEAAQEEAAQEEEAASEAAARGRPQALRLLVGGGYANQRGLERLVAIEDRCSPESGNCGPTRPAIDYGADVDLTEGWLNLKYECCPCLGRADRNTRIGYDQFDSAGSYNPYTMNLCTQCNGCS